MPVYTLEDRTTITTSGGGAGYWPGDVIAIAGPALAGTFRIVGASDAPWWRNLWAWWRWVALPAIQGWNPCNAPKPGGKNRS